MEIFKIFKKFKFYKWMKFFYILCQETYVCGVPFLFNRVFAFKFTQNHELNQRKHEEVERNKVIELN